MLSLHLMSSFVCNLMKPRETTKESARQSYDPELFSQLASIECVFLSLGEVRTQGTPTFLAVRRKLQIFGGCAIRYETTS